MVMAVVMVMVIPTVTWCVVVLVLMVMQVVWLLVVMAVGEECRTVMVKMVIVEMKNNVGARVVSVMVKDG